MQKRKVILILLAMFCAYAVGAGGIVPMLSSPTGMIEVLIRPIEQGSPFDVGLLMVAVVFGSWAALIGARGEGISRNELLRGVALGSALVTTGCLTALLAVYQQNALPQLLGILTWVAIGQGVVGLVAASMLMMKPESRKGSLFPMCLNGSLTALALCLIVGSLFS